MKNYRDDQDLFAQMKTQLFSAVIGDVMDKLGYVNQFLSPQIQPLHPEMVVVGRAMPVLLIDVYTDNGVQFNREALNKPFGLMLEALDDLKPHEVYLAAGASPRYALWGELMSTRAMQLKAAGAVLNGYSRDTKGILQLGFPTFSHGRYAQDQGPRGKVIDFRIRVEINGVRISPGDVIFGDLDGVCIIPKTIEKEVIRLAIEKVQGEKLVQKAISNGMSAGDAFAKYGIM